MKTLRLQERLDALRTLLAGPAPAPRCADCAWSVTRDGDVECHRHAPAPNSRSTSGDGRTRIFPIVSPQDACGDYAEPTCPH